MNILVVSHQSRPFLPTPFRKSFPQSPTNPHTLRLAPNSQQNPTPIAAQAPPPDDSIPADHVKTLAKFRSRHNYIRVLDVSRRADHPLAGSRLLLLDSPGNIHSLSFLFNPLTSTYFDVFATLPPLLPPGPLAILGFGAGTAARIILHLFPDTHIHGWELDPSVISVAREYFGLIKLEKQNPKSLSIYIGDALTAEVRDGFAGILVDLFSKGSLIPELQEPATWEMLKRRLRRGGRMMVNCGGSCVEAEDESRDGEVVMVQTLKAMREVFGEEMFVLNLGHRMEDSCVALTGPAPDFGAWKEALPVALRGYVDQWSIFKDHEEQ